MKYLDLFANPQAATATLHTVAHSIKRNNVTPATTTWAVAYANELPGVEIFAAGDSHSVVVFHFGEVVFSAGRQGQVLVYRPGGWESAVELLCEQAERAGALTLCPTTEEEMADAQTLRSASLARAGMQLVG